MDKVVAFITFYYIGIHTVVLSQPCLNECSCPKDSVPKYWFDALFSCGQGSFVSAKGISMTHAESVHF